MTYPSKERAVRTSRRDRPADTLFHRAAWRLGLAIVALGFAAGCQQAMRDQPRYEPLEYSSFFEDGRSSRPLVPNTIAQGHLRLDAHFFEGLVENQPATTLPERIELTREFLERGRERYDIYCSVCHDRAGTGRGRVVQRGFPQPPSLHEPRLREAPIGHIYRVATHGIRTMPPYEKQISPEDRWAISAYVRTLQLSQNLSLSEAPEDIRQQLEGEAP